MKYTIKLLLIVSLVFSSQLIASKLSGPKEAGLIGEQANGYVGLVKNASADVKALVKSVNQKRKASYKKIAANKELALSQVEKIGGKKAIEKTKAGHYIKRGGQGWTKKQ